MLAGRVNAASESISTSASVSSAGKLTVPPRVTVRESLAITLDQLKSAGILIELPVPVEMTCTPEVDELIA